MGEVFAAIVVIAVIAALLLFPLAIVFFVVSWARGQQRQRLSAWGGLAQRKNLQLSGDSIFGSLHGQRVRVATESRGSGKSRTTYTVVRGMLSTPLDLGLEVRRHGWLSDLFVSGQDIMTGHAGFDRAFRVTGDEDDRVRAALGNSLRALLFEHVGSGPTFYLNDHGMVIERQGVIRDPRWLDWALEVTSRASAKLERNRARIPVASALAPHQQAWAQYAEANGLMLNTTPLCVWGRVDRAEVYVYTVRTGVRSYQVEVSLRYPEHLQLGLHISPQGVFDKIAIFLGQQDQRFNDPVFDNTFRVRCADPARSMQLLTPTVRRRLLYLHAQLGPLTVNDEGISVRLPYVPHEPAMIPRVLHFLVELSDELQAALRDPNAGPYR